MSCSHAQLQFATMTDELPTSQDTATLSFLTSAVVQILRGFIIELGNTSGGRKVMTEVLVAWGHKHLRLQTTSRVNSVFLSRMWSQPDHCDASISGIAKASGAYTLTAHIQQGDSYRRGH